MTFPTHRLRLLGIAATLSAAAATAGATTSSSSVQITSFSYATSAGTLSWTDAYQSFAASALNAGGLLGAGTDAYDTADFGFATVGTSTSNATGAASTTAPQTFWATASSNSSTGAVTNQPNQGTSAVGQSASFSLSTAGTVTFSIGYRFDVAAAGGNAVTDYGSALLAFDAADSDGSSGGHLGDGLKSFAAGAAAGGSGGRTGTFTLAVDLTAGEIGFYSLQGNALAFSSAAAAVPEPASWLLMLAGIAGIAAGARRRRAATTV